MYRAAFGILFLLFLFHTPVSAASLVAQYLFNGDLLDSSGNGNGSAVTEGTVATATDRFGNAGNAYSVLTGTGNRILLPDSVMHSAGGTVSMWYKTDFDISGGNGSIWPFFASEAAPDGGGFLQQMSIALGDFTGPLSGEIMGNLGGTGSANPRSGVSADSTGVLAGGLWHHIAVTSNSSGHFYYLDGVQFASTLFHDGQTQTDNIWVSNPGTVSLGGLVSTDLLAKTFFVDDVLIFDDALSAAQIEAIANDVQPVPEPSTLALFCLGCLGLTLRRLRTRSVV